MSPYLEHWKTRKPSSASPEQTSVEVQAPVATPSPECPRTALTSLWICSECGQEIPPNCHATFCSVTQESTPGIQVFHEETWSGVVFKGLEKWLEIHGWKLDTYSANPADGSVWINETDNAALRLGETEFNLYHLRDIEKAREAFFESGREL